MNIDTTNKQTKLKRRGLLRHSAAGSLGLVLGGMSFAGASTEGSSASRTARALREIMESAVPRKVELVQEIYERHAFSPSGHLTRFSMM